MKRVKGDPIEPGPECPRSEILAPWMRLAPLGIPFGNPPTNPSMKPALPPGDDESDAHFAAKGVVDPPRVEVVNFQLAMRRVVWSSLLSAQNTDSGTHSQRIRSLGILNVDREMRTVYISTT